MIQVYPTFETSKRPAFCRAGSIAPFARLSGPWRAESEESRVGGQKVAGPAYLAGCRACQRHPAACLELRYPRVDVDLEGDKALLRVLALLPSTHTDAEFLGGVYHVIKPAVLAAVEDYLRQSDPLNDAPSHRCLRFVGPVNFGMNCGSFEAVWQGWTPPNPRRPAFGASGCATPGERRASARERLGFAAADAGRASRIDRAIPSR